MSVAILILAAGASSRMRGADKLLEIVDDSPQLLRVTLAALDNAPTYVTLPSLDHPRAAHVPAGAQILPVLEWADGMSASFKAGDAKLPEGLDILILPADMPELSADDIKTVLAARDANPNALIWQAAGKDRTPGHPVLFHASLRPAFAQLSGDEGARSIVAANAARRILVPLPGQQALIDLDTPEDWAEWRSRQ